MVRGYVSQCVSLTLKQLRTYKEILYWDYVSENEHIHWDTDIIDEFIDGLLPMVTEKDEYHYPFSGLSNNRSMPWSVELIDRYIDRWDWEEMVFNNILPREMRLHYHDRLRDVDDYDAAEADSFGDFNVKTKDFEWWREWFQIIEEIDEMKAHPELCISDPDRIAPEEVDWDYLSSSAHLPWSQELIARFHDRWNWWRLSANENIPWSETLLMRFEHKWNWTVISRNPALPWSESLITRLGMHWNWNEISQNEGLPWSYDLLKKFDCFLNWDKSLENEDGSISAPDHSVSINYSIPWTPQIWDAYHDRLDGHWVACSKTIHWDFDTLKGYCKHWKPHDVLSRKDPFLTAFPELKEPETLISLLDEILEKHKRGDYDFKGKL